MDLKWSEGTFSVSHLVEKTVQFPQLLKVDSSITPASTSISHNRSHLNGHADELNKSLNNNKAVISTSKGSTAISPLQVGDIFKLHGIKTFKKVIVTGAGCPTQTDCEEVANEYGYLSPPGSTKIYRQFSLPVGFSMPLQILPFRDINHVYPTAGDLVQERPRPNAVIVNKTITLPEKNCVIKEGDIMAITSVDKRCTSTGVVDFLICKHNDKTIGLPMSCVGNFTVLEDETIFTLNDLASKHVDIGLPQKIRFLEVSPENRTRHATLVRGGQHHIVPGAEYIAENVVKQQCLICTKCDDNTNSSVSKTQVYYIPTNSIIARNMRVRLPLFYDMASFKQTLNGRYCPNLSMRDILDATPVELLGEPNIIMRALSEVYNCDGPQLPPRSDIQQIDSVSLRSAMSSQYLNDPSGHGGNYANVIVLHNRMNSSDSNLSGLDSSFDARADNRFNLLQSPTPSERMEEQPLLGDGGGSESIRQGRCHGQNKTPVLPRKGTSTPCTPESRRRKNESPTWTEKISISLENLKRTFRKAGSEEKERTKIGDGSQLADSFENLSTCGGSESVDLSPPHCGNYENVKLVSKKLDKPVGRTRPILKFGGIPPSKCSQIRELWTPPCSPDYRDHTTSSLEPIHTGYSQFNNSNSNQVAFVRPSTERQQSNTTDSGGVLQKSSTEPVMTFSYQNFDQPKWTKSPKATPRITKDIHVVSNGLYENVGNLMPSANMCSAGQSEVISPSRCSGYSSSGSRGSSENDLIHYQLETIKSVDMIPEDLTTLSLPGLCDCLYLFELSNVANKFKQNQIDGHFFMIMTDHMFRDEAFSFSEFEILKLKRLRDGWRPRL